MNIALLNVTTKELTWMTDTKWEASAGSFAPDGKRYTYTLNEDGTTDAYLGDLTNDPAEKLELPRGSNTISGNTTEFSPDGKRLDVSHEASNRPRDFWLYNIGSHRGSQLTFSTTGSLRTVPRPASQTVHYKSFDGKTITALLWIPFNLKRDGINPAIVMAHGGPAWQRTDDWEPESAALVSHGYICIAPNPRGSTGYGSEFEKANYRDLGNGDLKDELGAVDFLKATEYVDPQKIGIFGQSYGGS